MNSNNIATVIVDNSPKMAVLLNNGDRYSTDSPHTDTLKENLLLNGIDSIGKARTNGKNDLVMTKEIKP